MSSYPARRTHAPDSAEQHRNWLSLLKVGGPFLSLPVLRATWPALDALDKPAQDRLRLEHTSWQAVEWHDNISISDLPPATYWPDQLAKKKLPEPALLEQIRWHALPDGWSEMPYDTFLAHRRKLMSDVVRTAFGRLADQHYAPVYPAPGVPVTHTGATRTQYPVRVTDLVNAGLLSPATVLFNLTDDVEAAVQADGRIEFDGTAYDSPSGASDAAHGGITNGWTYWLADTAGGVCSPASVRIY